MNGSVDTRKPRKKRKKYHQFNVLFSTTDYEVFAALYKHRLLTVEMLYQLVVKKTGTHTFESFRARLKKLSVKGYLEAQSVSGTDVLKTDHVHAHERAYYLSDKGVHLAASFLRLDEYGFDAEGAFNKRYLEAAELKVHKQIDHHFLTQRVVVDTLCTLEEKNEGMRFYEYIYGYGDSFALTWEYEGKTKRIFPDWVFLPLPESHGSSLGKIAIEADRSTMNVEQLERKLLGYRNHVYQNSEQYQESPLHLVIAVESKSTKRRIRTLLQNSFLIFEDLIHQGLIKVYVKDYREAPLQIVNILENTPYEVDIDGCRHALLRLVTRNTGYTLRNELLDYQSEDLHGLKMNPDREFVFWKASEEEKRIFLLSADKGSVNDQARAIYMKQELLKEPRFFVLMVYPTRSSLVEDVFIDTVNRQRQIVNFGKQILLTSMEDLNEGRLYQVEADYKKSQKLKAVMIQDVFH